ncbi:MAG: D-alanyl-D-alanine carboxypeptidase, partial [Solobacterium sp.]|nr:D-alanyl-D-alanine carboxypeptidase [Solobacterium sp.]
MKPTKLYRGLLCGMLAASALSLTPVNAEAQTPDPTLYEGLGSDYIYVEDIESGQVLTEKNSEQKMYPASMTKMLTVIVALEHLNDMDEIIEITEQMTEGLIEQEASLAGFGAGDRVTVRDLLYGTALPSGADAANGLAFTVAGSIKNYVALMNEKAQEIGMANSHFANCTGLHEDDHYTTA